MKVPIIFQKMAAGLSAKSPEICHVSGLMFMIAGGVWACVQTAKKGVDVVEQHQADKLYLKEAVIDDKYTEKDQKHDLRELYFDTCIDLAKTYAGPIAVVAVGVTINSIGFGKMKKRYLAAAALYEASVAAFEKAMDRVREKYGEEGERWARYGESTEHRTHIDENGEVKEADGYSGDPTDESHSQLEMVIDRGVLYDCSGTTIRLVSQLTDYEAALNTQYFAGTPIYLYDVLRYIFGNQLEEKLRTKGLMNNDIRTLGWFNRDPENKANTDMKKPINLRIRTFWGPVNGSENDTDKLHVAIDPNVPGFVDLSNAAPKRIVGGKYLSQV